MYLSPNSRAIEKDGEILGDREIQKRIGKMKREFESIARDGIDLIWWDLAHGLERI